MRALFSLLAVSMSFSCGSPQTSSPTPASSDQAPPSDQPPADDRPGLSAAACEAQGGRVVGDIGDGAIHRPDYRCQPSGEAPLGGIVPDPGGPVAIEGAVCCK